MDLQDYERSYQFSLRQVSVEVTIRQYVPGNQVPVACAEQAKLTAINNQAAVVANERMQSPRDEASPNHSAFIRSIRLFPRHIFFIRAFTNIHQVQLQF